MLKLLGAVRDKPRWWTKAYLVASLKGCAPEDVNDADATVDAGHYHADANAVMDKWVAEMRAHDSATDAEIEFVRCELDDERSMLAEEGPYRKQLTPGSVREDGFFSHIGHGNFFHMATSSVAARKAAVEGTYQRDDPLPTHVHQALVAGFAMLSAVEPRDWHPGSGELVLDLVHPSLYCYERGVTRVTGPGEDDVENDVENDVEKDVENDVEKDVENDSDGSEKSGGSGNPWGARMASIFGGGFLPRMLEERRGWRSRRGLAWLPAEVAVSEDGSSCTFSSYINNLHPREHAGLYYAIADTFAASLPLLERVLEALLQNRPPRVETPQCDYDSWKPVDGAAYLAHVRSRRLGAWHKKPVRALRKLLSDVITEHAIVIPPYSAKASDGSVSEQKATVQAATKAELLGALETADERLHDHLGFIGYVKLAGDGLWEQWVERQREDPWVREAYYDDDDDDDDDEELCAERRAYTGFEFLPKLEPLGFHQWRDRVQQAHGGSAARISLHGCQLQVIVKLASIELTPERPRYPGGSWHVEGMQDESIVATAIYYVASENVTAPRLDFRCAVDEGAMPYEQNEIRSPELYYGIENLEPGSYEEDSDPDKGRHQGLGGCTTRAQRMLAWPNTLQHRVAPFELADASQPGRRSMLVFFLVDPFVRVRSTATVPPQQAEWLARELRRMPFFCDLPVDVMKLILSHVPGLLTFEQAAARRKRLMRERKYFEAIVNEEIFERPFSLCEH